MCRRERLELVERHARDRSPPARRARGAARRSARRGTRRTTLQRVDLDVDSTLRIAASVSMPSANDWTSARSAGSPKRCDDVLDQQRRLVVRERDRARVLEAGVQIAQLEDLAGVDRARKRQLHLAAPFRPRPLLLEHRDAFGEPARDALIRQLQRDHVRDLVPQRRAPVERRRAAAPSANPA